MIPPIPRLGAIGCFILFLLITSLPFLFLGSIYFFETIPKFHVLDDREETNAVFLFFKLLGIFSLCLSTCFCGAFASVIFGERTDRSLILTDPFAYMVYIWVFSFITCALFLPLLLSGMITGTILPQISFTGIDFRLGIDNIAKFAVWFFVFGFFERLIPDSSAKLVGKLGGVLAADPAETEPTRGASRRIEPD